MGYFKEAFEKEFLEVDMQYVRAQEYLRIRQKDMTIKEFSTKLNSIA